MVMGVRVGASQSTERASAPRPPACRSVHSLRFETFFGMDRVAPDKQWALIASMPFYKADTKGGIYG